MLPCQSQRINICIELLPPLLASKKKKKRCAANYYSEQESRLVLDRMLNEWLVYKNFLQLSVVGQMENMNAGCVIEITVSRRGRCEK